MVQSALAAAQANPDRVILVGLVVVAGLVYGWRYIWPWLVPYLAPSLATLLDATDALRKKE